MKYYLSIIVSVEIWKKLKSFGLCKWNANLYKFWKPKQTKITIPKMFIVFNFLFKQYVVKTPKVSFWKEKKNLYLIIMIQITFNYIVYTHGLYRYENSNQLAFLIDLFHPNSLSVIVMYLKSYVKPPAA